MSKTSGYMENTLRQNFFRAEQPHASAIVILSLVCQIIADSAVLPSPLVWFVHRSASLGDPHIGHFTLLTGSITAVFNIIGGNSSLHLLMHRTITNSVCLRKDSVFCLKAVGAAKG